jgi:hypothetical protein
MDDIIEEPSMLNVYLFIIQKGKYPNLDTIQTNRKVKNVTKHILLCPK